MKHDAGALDLSHLSERELTPRAAPAGTDLLPTFFTRFGKCLIVAVCFLVGAGIVASYLRYGPQSMLTERFVEAFLVNFEHNVPTWFSTVLLFTNALLLSVIAGFAFQVRDRWRWYWCGLALVFMYLSLDEAAQLHESAMVPVREAFDLSGPFHYAWVVPAMACLTIFAMLYLRFTLALPKKTMLLFILAAVMYVGGAIGVEMVSSDYIWNKIENGLGRDIGYDLLGVLEESLEMFGQVVFFHALAGYILSRWNNVLIRVGR